MIRQFTEKNHQVVGLARDEQGARLIRNLGGEAFTGSIFDAAAMARGVGEADVVIHAATAIPTKVPGKPEDWAMNDRLRREGTRALTEAAGKIGAKTYIQQSVVWVARPADDSFFDETTPPVNPDPLYQSAYDGERIAFEAGERFGYNVTVLRGGGFYSAEAAHTRLFAEGLLRRRLPLIGKGDAISANIHVEDAASAFVAAAIRGKQGLWHITDDDPVPLGEMMAEFARRLEAPAPWRIPLWLAKLFIWKGAIQFFTRSTRTTNRLFKQEIGWSPRYPSFREGLHEVVRTWRAEGFANSGGAR
jgi:nucleoside-diphosphate-sugar epimerase